MPLSFILVCSSFWSQLRGYMWRTCSYDALLFTLGTSRRVALHTWFVFFPLDIYYLDASGTILARYLRVRPFTCYLAGVAAAYILETAQPTSFALGARLDIKHIKRLAAHR